MVILTKILQDSQTVFPIIIIIITIYWFKSLLNAFPPNTLVPQNRNSEKIRSYLKYDQFYYLPTLISTLSTIFWLFERGRDRKERETVFYKNLPI